MPISRVLLITVHTADSTPVQVLPAHATDETIIKHMIKEVDKWNTGMSVEVIKGEEDDERTIWNLQFDGSVSDDELFTTHIVESEL